MTTKRETHPSVIIEDCIIEYQEVRFLITKSPSDSTVDKYINKLLSYNVKNVVRVCGPTYKTAPLEALGIHVIDLEFEDGRGPSPEVLNDWFVLLKQWFRESPGSCVAVHCVSGLGRSPLMVGLTLLELGMKCKDAVDMIRSHRRGALNEYQVTYLQRYRPKSRFKLRN